jgi:hypothetical protein
MAERAVATTREFELPPASPIASACASDAECHLSQEGALASSDAW